MIQLSDWEQRIVASLLSYASDVVSNRCCNDFELSELAEPQQVEQLHAAMERWNRGPIPTPEVDWLLMSYFAAKMVGAAK